MYIHVVQAGQSLWGISQLYGLTYQSVIAANLLSSTNIVPGQSLVIPIPTRAYVVLPGDTLGTIAKRYRVSVQQLLAWNPQVQGTTVNAGQILSLPTVQRPNKVALGFLELVQAQTDAANVYANAPYYTYLAPFGFGMTTTGAIVGTQDAAALAALVNTQALPAATFSNWVDNQFSPGAVHVLLSSTSTRQQYVAEVLRIVQAKGYKAVVIDFESIHPEDRDTFVEFLSELKTPMQSLGIPLIVCVMPITGRLPYEGVTIRAYDYAGIARHSDYVMLMSYNWSWPGGPPGPVSSLPLVEDNIRYALARMSSKKVLLGLVRYGYDWTLPYQPGEATSTLAIDAVVDLAMQSQIPIQFDPQSFTLSFRYWDRQGVEHVVWFEDARSLQMKLQLVQKYRLAGVAAWELHEGFPQFNQLLTDNFQIEQFPKG